MRKKKSRLELAREQALYAVNETNQKIDELGMYTNVLFKNLNTMQEQFDIIRNVPSEQWIKIEKLKKVRFTWKQQAEKIEKDYNEAKAANVGKGMAGVGFAFAVGSLGPTVAMGIATTFGVASTGTLISSLSGAAATNAALAWLGGGALAAGGGGMVAGHAFLALAGPVGWTIAACSIGATGISLWIARNKNKRLEDIFCLISKRDVNNYKLAIVELSERIIRINEESTVLEKGIEQIKTFGVDYGVMTEAQQYQLGTYLNMMYSSTQLLVEPILGLLPKYTDDDFKKYAVHKGWKFETDQDLKKKNLIISLSNLLYKINLDAKDQKLLWKSLRRNKKFLKSINYRKKEFRKELLEQTCKALSYKYKHQ